MRHRVRSPLDDATARALRVGDEVLLSGRILTGRAAARRWLLQSDRASVRALAQGAVLFHCAPVVVREAGAWRVVAAAPSHSAREEPYEAELLARYALRGVLGRGGMGSLTLAALAKIGAVYLHAAPGLAVALASSVRRVEAVHGAEALGLAEAIWTLQVEDLPAVVSMDAHGQSLHVLRGDALRPEAGA